jgi:hypothetical protein
MPSENVKLIVANTESMWLIEDAIDQAYATAYEKYPELKAIDDAEKARDGLMRELQSKRLTPGATAQPTVDEYLESLTLVEESHPEWSEKLAKARVALEAASAAAAEMNEGSQSGRFTASTQN